MRAEMEFYFALDGASMLALRAACGAHGEPDLVPAQNRTLAGLMNGKIDLVFQHDGRFHVLDYKGNNLGDCVEHYSGDALTARLDASDYRFQALLYTVALDRYLSQRLDGYERCRHLGDCYYIFIRAVGLGDGAGIWRHRFSDGLLDAVQAVLATTGNVEVAA
jgi:exodeoxyribonuclease V beta subunit